MDQTVLATLFRTGDENAENTCIAQYLGTLEVICTNIAERVKCDAEELLSEGYVRLVTTFRNLVNDSREEASKGDPNINYETCAQNLVDRLTAQLKLELEKYALESKSPVKAGIDEIVGTPSEPTVEDTNNQKVHVTEAVSVIPDHLINPFTHIAKLCHEIGGSCYPPASDEQPAYATIIAKILATYSLNETEAIALLRSYEQYVDTILAAHFNDQQQ